MRHRLILEWDTSNDADTPDDMEQLLVAGIVEHALRILPSRVVAADHYIRPEPKWNLWASPPQSREAILDRLHEQEREAALEMLDGPDDV